MPDGKVKWFNAVKGFGFITGSDGQDVFMHKSDVNGQPLQEGDKVQYEIGKAPKGVKAINVVKIG